MRNGDGPVRDEERGTRELPAGRVDGLDGPRRAVEGVDGIPEQARPHPEDAQESLLSGQDDGQRDPEGAAPSTSSEGRRLVTGGTMSEHERHDKPEVQSVQGTQHGPSAQHIQHDPQDRSGARAMFIELRKLQDGSAEYAELRNQLVRMHLPLVEHLARRFRNRGEPLDDLTQVATIGLIKSVDRFDPERGVEFSTYATPTVVGEIKRHFRDKGWAVRVPRRLQELRLALTTATAELSQQHGRSPTVHELAEKLAISEEEVLEGLESANAYSTLSLDVPDTDDESPAVADTLGAEDEALEGVEYRESLKPLLEDLPPREKRILLLRFFGNMTQSQIAQEVGISQMHVSRLLARTLAQLREKLLVEE
ncbi:RNA polymerase sigma factor SigF [Streptomyces sp. NPDC007095]|uniref:RNA polymerase sigma factor SigF n=1 Tax=Streptomyces sp. NPDC007095 TaxID=3154482 RepID=UPI000C711B95|nr:MULTISPECIES: RNA polymerase sigma factor SigF [Streptomyces]QIY73353.1 RNA polymerase sigma factor SigF [Streptomyces sp. RLB1-33]QUW79669.1 RNA polymerase sigma factor SigF [Streptomyces mirabilis]